jgi:hypothetical protein
LIEWGTKQEEKKERVNILIDEWPIIELARIGYKSSGISVYLPKRVSKALRLDKGTNKSLVIMADRSYSILLMKDTKVAEMRKPLVLDMRKALGAKLDKLP